MVNTPPLLLVIQILTLHGLAGTGGLWVGKPSDTIINPSEEPQLGQVRPSQHWTILANIWEKTAN